jgi:hypothetical protein
MATIPPPDILTGRTLIYDGLAQNDVDMANHRLLHLDTSNLPPFGQPPAFHPPANEWIHDFDMADPLVWHSRRPQFVDIGPDNGTLTSQQQSRIAQLGDIRSGVWHGTPLEPDRVPTLENIRHPQGNVDLNFKRIINVADPVDPGDAVNMRFMDGLLQGLVVKEAVKCATTRSLTVLEGEQIIDGVPAEVDDRVLVKDQNREGGTENGIYVVTESGHWTRSDDCDTSDELLRAYCTVLQGDRNSGTSWVQVTPAFVHDPPQYPPDVIAFVQFSSAQSLLSSITAGSGLSADATTLNVGGTPGRIAVNPDNVDIDPAYVGQDSITTLGAVTTGTWHAEIIDGARGGTGHANPNREIRLIGDLAVVFALDAPDVTHDASLSFILTGNTSLRLPQAGTVATIGGVENLTNKTLVKRVAKIASNAKPSINTENVDAFCITALSESIGSMSDNLTGTAIDRQELDIWIKQATGSIGPASGGWNIAWGTKYMDSSDLPLPLLTTPDAQMYLKFIYVSELFKWVLTQKLDKIS